MQGIEPQSMGCKLRVLQVLMYSRLNFDNKIKIFSNKIGKKILPLQRGQRSSIRIPLDPYLRSTILFPIKQAATHYGRMSSQTFHSQNCGYSHSQWLECLAKNKLKYCRSQLDFKS